MADTIDPREKNVWFSASSASEYLGKYADALSQGLRHIGSRNLDEVIRLLQITRESGKNVFTCGNGGSAAIAEHLCCDWSKGTYLKNSKPLKSHSLTSNSSLLTALSNDFGYQTCFAKQLEMLADEGDILIAISSSGNSENILQAVEVARAKKMSSVGLTGFDGGRLAKAVDINLHVPLKNYGIVEDTHQAIMHIIAQWVYLQSL